MIAPEELNQKILLTSESEERLDIDWRVVGRSIHLLSLIKSGKLLDTLLLKSDSIASKHLKYHILEFILKSGFLNRIGSKIKIIKLTRKILKYPQDEIIKFYSKIIYLKVLCFPKRIRWLLLRRQWNRTYLFVVESTNDKNEIEFFRKFWVRNHGLECLSEELPKRYVSLYTELVTGILRKEDSFLYPTNKPFYYAIYKSTLLSMFKLADKDMQPVADLLFRSLILSERFTTSSWAMKYATEWIEGCDSSRLGYLKELYELKNANKSVKGIIKMKIERLESKIP